MSSKKGNEELKNGTLTYEEKIINLIIASLYHVSDYHERCPKTNDTWCQFQKDKIDGTDYTKINMVYP